MQTGVKSDIPCRCDLAQKTRAAIQRTPKRSCARIGCSVTLLERVTGIAKRSYRTLDGSPPAHFVCRTRSPLCPKNVPPGHFLNGQTLSGSISPIRGAGDGNRTHTTSLEGWGSTIELHPRIRPDARHVPKRRAARNSALNDSISAGDMSSAPADFFPFYASSR